MPNLHGLTLYIEPYHQLGCIQVNHAYQIERRMFVLPGFLFCAIIDGVDYFYLNLDKYRIDLSQNEKEE